MSDRQVYYNVAMRPSRIVASVAQRFTFDVLGVKAANATRSDGGADDGASTSKFKTQKKSLGAFNRNNEETAIRKA